MNEQELKACPFCGGTLELRRAENFGSERSPSSIKCRHCNFWIARSGIDSDDAITKIWNTRPIEDAIHAELAELENVDRKDANLAISLYEENAALKKDNEEMLGVFAENISLLAQVASLQEENEALRAFFEVWRMTQLDNTLDNLKAMSRPGIAFTDEQKELIAKMVEKEGE